MHQIVYVGRDRGGNAPVLWMCWDVYLCTNEYELSTSAFVCSYLYIQVCSHSSYRGLIRLDFAKLHF